MCAINRDNHLGKHGDFLSHDLPCWPCNMYSNHILIRSGWGWISVGICWIPRWDFCWIPGKGLRFERCGWWSVATNMIRNNIDTIKNCWTAQKSFHGCLFYLQKGVINRWNLYFIPEPLKVFLKVRSMSLEEHTHFLAVELKCGERNLRRRWNTQLCSTLPRRGLWHVDPTSWFSIVTWWRWVCLNVPGVGESGSTCRGARSVCNVASLVIFTELIVFNLPIWREDQTMHIYR